MKKTLVILSLLLFLLAACATATPTPAPTEVVTQADPSMATPIAGWVLVREVPGAKAAYLFSAPDPKAATLGEIALGQTGDLQGLNAAGDWVLVKFDDQIGWMPATVLIITSEY
jgi:hypothetical protein